MTIQMSTAVRNARLDEIQTTIGNAPLLIIYDGDMPDDCSTDAAGTALATLTLPSSWMADAADGEKDLSGTWTGNATVAGTAGYYRIYDADGTTCHMQGTISITDGDGDMILDNTDIAVGQTVTVTSFTLTDGNA